MRQSHPTPITAGREFQVSVYNAQESAYSRLNLSTTLPYWTVSHVVSGEVTTITQREAYAAHPGDVMIHPPHVPFSEIARGPGVHQWFYFDAEIDSHLELYRLYPVAYVVHLNSPHLYSQLFSMLQGCWNKSGDTARETMVCSYAAALLSLIIQSWHTEGGKPRTSAPGNTKERFYLLISQMQEHLQHRWNRAELAGLAHLHPVYLDRAFQACYGVTPMQFLRNLRLRRARRLLEDSDITLAAVAENCGITDAAYLSRLFQQAYGISPGDYRKTARRNTANYLMEEMI